MCEVPLVGARRRKGRCRTDVDGTAGKSIALPRRPHAAPSSLRLSLPFRAVGDNADPRVSSQLRKMFRTPFLEEGEIRTEFALFQSRVAYPVSEQARVRREKGWETRESGRAFRGVAQGAANSIQF